MGPRQAWCPRCDDVQPARPGRPCPTCGSTLLAVPTQTGGRRPAPARLDLRTVVGQARGRLLPATRAALAGLAAVALVAGTFVAGRATRTDAAAAPAATTASTLFGFGGPEGNRQRYNWSSGLVRGIELSLRSIDAGDRNTTFSFEASGVPDAHSIISLQGLSVTDADGRQLMRTTPIPDAPARGSAFSGDQLALVTVEDRLTDKAAVARVQVDRVTLASQVEEQVAVTLVDPRLGHLPLHASDPCPGCKLDAHCTTSCTTMTVAGAAYHQDEVVVLLAPKGPVDRSVLGAGEPDVLISDAKLGSEVQPAIDREPGGVTAVQFNISDLALGGTNTRAQIQMVVSTELHQTIRGPWRMRQR